MAVFNSNSPAEGNKVSNFIEAVGKGKVKMFILIIIIIMGCMLIYIEFVRRNCPPEAPDVPIFPGSNLVKQPTVFNSQIMIITSVYIVNDIPQRIVEFYQQHAVCHNTGTDRNTVCRGDAEPQGTYYIHIPYESNIETRYIVEVGWNNFCNFDVWWEKVPGA